jgi:hypothetical protein
MSSGPANPHRTQAVNCIVTPEHCRPCLNRAGPSGSKESITATNVPAERTAPPSPYPFRLPSSGDTRPLGTFLPGLDSFAESG